MKIFCCDHLSFPVPPGHPLPIEKYSLLRAAIIRADLVHPPHLAVPKPVTDEQILHAHDAAYLHRVTCGKLTPQEIRRIGLPWSPQLVARARCAAGGTVAACRAAMHDGIAINLSGGTHHAFHDHGQGYCLFNDCVIAARTMQAEQPIQRVLILDCDAHQGNGTASLAANDPTLFTFSIHNQHNFPLHKVESDLDIGLEDGTGDVAYLEALELGVRQALHRADADLVIYLAGADPYKRDLLGHLALSKAGLAARDRFVLSTCRDVGLPVVTVMAGGYTQDVKDTVDIHLQTVRIAAKLATTWYESSQPPPASGQPASQAPFSP